MENNILQTLSKEEKQLLQVKTFKNKEILFTEGDICTSVSIVVTGQIQIISTSFEGREIIFNTIEKGKIFGNNLIFSDKPCYKGDVICTKDATIVFINKSNLVTILQSNKEFLIQYLSIQSNFGKKLNSTIKLLSYDSAEDRFRFYLHSNNNSISYKSVTELAKTLYLQRETLSRLLTKLEKENVIIRSPHHIKLSD